MGNSETFISEIQLNALPFCKKNFLLGQLYPIRPIRGGQIRRVGCAGKKRCKMNKNGVWLGIEPKTPWFWGV